MVIFEYGEGETAHLRRRDPRLGAAIDAIGPIRREVTPEPFAALAGIIVGQQVSSKAAKTITGRLAAAFPGLDPRHLAEADPSRIQACGMTFRKAGHIKALAAEAAGGGLDRESLAALSDEEAVRRLTSLPGLGLWSAEMFLLFCLRRPDVVSWGDLAIRRGMAKLYGCKTLTRSAFDRRRNRYSPHGSVASLYLWAVAAGA